MGWCLEDDVEMRSEIPVYHKKFIRVDLIDISKRYKIVQNISLGKSFLEQ